MTEPSDGNTVVDFIDEDGERALFKAEQIAQIEIPLWVTHPELEDGGDDPIDP